MNKLKKMFSDKSRPIQERLFIVIGALGIFTVFSMFIVGILIGENSKDIIILGVGCVIFSLLAYIAIKYDKIDVVSTITSLVITIGVLPAIFFYGGGIFGGGPLWFVFASLFTSMIILGKKKYTLLFLNLIVSFICYEVSYLYPEIVVKRDKGTIYADAYISLVFVCVMLFVMVGVEVWEHKKEAEHSEEQRKEIESLNAAQNRFFSSMSHEIRTPINTIIGLNEMILRENISEEVAEDAKSIQSASRMLLSLINDILDMSKMESGKMQIVMAPYDVEKMISEVGNMIMVRAKEKDLDFYIDVDPTIPCQLFSDEMRIKQILINLLNNAVKYTAEGSVTLSIHCHMTQTDRALVTYSVEDTGMGVRRENIPYLFDAFRREDAEKNKYIEGTGLGLSIVKQLADLLGGEISVNSVYTQGSTFAVAIEQEVVDKKAIGKFNLKKSDLSDGASGYSHRIEAPRANVLIVDDNETNLFVEKKLLRDTLINVDTALSGRECLNLTGQKHYDVILMDHMMPNMDGIECLHEIRRQRGGANTETPVVVLTANAGSENAALYRREGFDDYLVKPIESVTLENMLARLLPESLVTIRGEEIVRYDSDKVLREMGRKIPILITTESVSDIPPEYIQYSNIPILPYKVKTDTGVFYDGVEAKGDVMAKYMENSDFRASSLPPTVSEYEAFFAKQLSKAQHIIHIAMAKKVGEGYANACEAALSFYNVKVVDSGLLSSGMGFIINAAKEMAESGQYDSEAIVEEIEKLKPRINTGYVLGDTEGLYRSGRFPESLHRLCQAFMIRPAIRMRNSNIQMMDIAVGSREKTGKKYIKKILRNKKDIDKDVLFVSYAGMTRGELDIIESEIEKEIKFDKVYFKKTTPAIAINCGLKTFSLAFLGKE